MAQQIYSLAELDAELKNARGRIVLTYYSSPKCGLCRNTDTFINNLCEQYPDVLFKKVDTEASPEFVNEFHITGLPAFQFHRGCEKLYEFAGANTEHLLMKLCQFMEQ